MGESATASRGPELAPGWEHRLVAAIPLPAWPTGIAITAVLVTSYLVHAAVLGLPVLDEPHQALPIDGGAWTAFVFCLLAGYTFVAGRQSLLRTGDDVASLASGDADEASALRARFAEAVHQALPRSRVFGALGFAFGASITTVVMLTQGFDDARFELAFVWFYVVATAQWWQIARSAYFTLLGGRVLREVAEGVPIDLLEASPLESFSRMGLRNAFSWVATTSIMMLLFLNIPLDRLGTAYGAVLGILCFAGVAFVLPLRSARRLIRRAKARELSRVNDEIRQSRGTALASRAVVDAGAARLPGLIAYRGLVEAVREWPLDTPTLGRFALYLAIPVGGWLGGALVERLVDAVLD